MKSVDWGSVSLSFHASIPIFVLQGSACFWPNLLSETMAFYPPNFRAYRSAACTAAPYCTESSQFLMYRVVPLLPRNSVYTHLCRHKQNTNLCYLVHYDNEKLCEKHGHSPLLRVSLLPLFCPRFSRSFCR